MAAVARHILSVVEGTGTGNVVSRGKKRIVKDHRSNFSETGNEALVSFIVAS